MVQSWIGAAIAAMAPLAVFAATEQISRLAFAVGHESASRSESEPAGGELLSPGSRVGAMTGRHLAITPRGKDVQVEAGWVKPAQEAESESVESSAQLEESREVQSMPEGLGQVRPVQPRQESLAGEDPDGFAAWVSEQIAAGETITGVMAGEFLGKSDRTGRNRLNALREERPEIFEGER